MADNTTLPGTGDVIADDDIGGVKFQRVKLIHGVDGTNDGDVANTNGFPCKGSYVTATLQNAVSATGNGSSLSVLGLATVVFQVSGTFTATVTFEGSPDAGTTWVGLVAQQFNSSGVLVTGASAPGTFQAQCAGLTHVRGRVTWTSGTSVTVTAYAVPNPVASQYISLGSFGPLINGDVGAPASTTLRVAFANGATTPVRAEDDASANLDPGIVILARRTATPANTSGTDLDYEVPQMSAGRLWVSGDNTAGDVAHDGVDSGNPVKVGMRAIAFGTNPTAVAAADRTDWLANRAGVPFVIGGHPNTQTIRLQFTAAQTDVAVITVGAGLKIVVTSFQFTLDNASTVFPKVLLGFGTANTPTTTQVIGAHGGVPAGGGFGRGDGSGIIGVGADNEDLRITTVGAATGNGCELCVTYFTVES